MRITYLLLTCCLLVSTLVVSQVQATGLVGVGGIPAAAGIPSRVMDGSFMFSKEIEIEAKDIIVNVGKVNIEISKDQQQEEKNQKLISSPDAEEADAEEADAEEADNEDVSIETTTPVPRTNIEKEIEIEAKDIIVNIGKVKVEIEKNQKHSKVTKPIGKPGKKPIKVTTDPIDPIPSTPSAEVPTASTDNTIVPLFEDFTPTVEPSADETVLGENATAAITVQGGEKFDERGVLILTGPQIFSVTFKIIKEKVITIKGSNLKDEFGVQGIDTSLNDGLNNRPRREAVTFIIRGRGFVPGGTFFNDISDMVDGTSRGGMFEFLEPRVFLGAIPLKVVRFTDTTIIARFLDFEDQRRFEAGTLLARVKVLHVELRENKKHGPGEDIGILGVKERNEIASVGGLVLPALGAIGGSITSGPVLGTVDGVGVGFDGKNNKHEDGFSNSLLGLFSGLRFDTAVLSVQFSEKDAQRIRGSFNTLFLDDGSLGFPDLSL